MSGTLTVVADAAASGGSFVQARVGTHGRTYPNTDVAEYCVTVPVAGEYRIDADVWAPTARDDSFFVAIDNGPVVLWDLAIGEGFGPDQVTNRGEAGPAVWNLSAGNHVVRFHHREDGAGLDRFALVSTTPPPAPCLGLSQEAEDGSLRGSMVTVADAEASGGGYVMPADGTNGRTFPNDDFAEYCVNIPTAGEYRIEAVVRAPNANDDSFYVAIDEGPAILWDLDRTSGFGPDVVSDRLTGAAASWNLTAGAHIVRFHHREDGAGLDRFELTRVIAQPTATPTSVPRPRGITFYDEANWRGTSHSVGVGIHTNMNSWSIADNSASSFHIDPGYLAVVCSNADGTGICRAHTNPRAELFEFDNTISYVQVRRAGEPIVFYPGNDLTQIVQRMPAGSSFEFTPGVYRGHKILAKDNTRFVGAPGAVLDGGNNRSLPHAFNGVGDNVTIRGFEIRNYASGWMNGAITSRLTSDFSREGLNWLVEDNEIHHNTHGGINVGSGMTIRNNRIHNNGQIGITGIGDEDHRLRDITIDNNEIYNNATDVDGFRFTWHEGGVKITRVDNLDIVNNRIWDNYGRQVFCDARCDDVVIADNYIESSEPPARRNRNNPVMFEVSSNGIIRNNTIELTVTAEALTDSAIRIAESKDVLVEDNTISVINDVGLNAWGLDYRNQRADRHPGGNVTFRNNRVTAVRGEVRVGESEGLYTANIAFEDNAYSGDIDFRIRMDSTPWWQWQAAGRDAAGLFE